jgi:hypothetical protein
VRNDQGFGHKKHKKHKNRESQIALPAAQTIEVSVLTQRITGGGESVSGPTMDCQETFPPKNLDGGGTIRLAGCRAR